MGAVYRATNTILDRAVALKVLPDELGDDREARQRFQREIRTALALEHPNVIPAYDAGLDDGLFFIAMRLIDGPDLSVVAENGPIETSRAIRLCIQVAGALAYMHRMGHIHRDVKPQNILVAECGTPHEYALLTDFGIARARDSVTQLTRGVIGTPAYLSPEVVEWKPATYSSDQYALACVVFEMLAGRPPFVEDLPAAHIQAMAPQLRELKPSIPDYVDLAVAKALAKDPGQRFTDMEEFARALSDESEPRGATPSGSGGVTLHGELAAILAASGGRTSLTDLEHELQQRGRYRRRDGSIPDRAQVLARLRSYPEMFRRDGEQIRLLPAGRRHVNSSTQ